MKTRFLPGVALAAFLLALTSGAQARDDITDAQIRDVVARVARHQLHPLSDGDYAPVTTLDAARAARPPAGLIWNYPQGVTLYGMARSVELTGDREVDKFVVEHNQIAARYWRWLAGVMAQFGKPGQDFAHTTGIGMLADLGSLDSCGAMGNALLDSMMRHPESVTL